MDTASFPISCLTAIFCVSILCLAMGKLISSESSINSPSTTARYSFLTYLFSNCMAICEWTASLLIVNIIPLVSLSNLWTIPAFNGPLKAGIVHRLDRDTSGIMLTIKSDAVHSHIAMQFEKRYVRKEYLAVVEGELMLDSDEISLPIARHKIDSQKMAVRHDIGKEAVSIYEVIERFRGYTLVNIMPKTGRTHQIRVHMRAIGHPVVADFMYSNQESCYLSDLLQKEREPGEVPIIERQALHAHRIEFFPSIKKKKKEFEVDLPEDISTLVKTLRDVRPYRN